jgi:hypothetical protein
VSCTAGDRYCDIEGNGILHPPETNQELVLWDQGLDLLHVDFCQCQEWRWQIPYQFNVGSLAINFPLNTAFVHSTGSGILYFHFHLTFLTSLLIFQWLTDCLKMCLYSFCSFTLAINVILFHCDLISCKKLFWCSFVYWDLLYDLKCDLLWIKFHGLLRRMCTLQLLDGISCRYLIHGTVHLWNFLLSFLVGMIYVLMWVKYWSHPLLLYLDLSVPLCPVEFTLWTVWTSIRSI